MSKAGKWIALAAACVAFNVGVAVAADEKPVDVAGDWQLTIQSPQGTRTPTVTLEQDGGNMTGKVKLGQRGEQDFTGKKK